MELIFTTLDKYLTKEAAFKNPTNNIVNLVDIGKLQQYQYSCINLLNNIKLSLSQNYIYILFLAYCK